jgi:hypothetical protein
VRKLTNTFFAALEKATKNDLKYVFFFDLSVFSNPSHPLKYNQGTTFLISLSELMRRRREAAGEEPEEDVTEDQEETVLRGDM